MVKSKKKTRKVNKTKAKQRVDKILPVLKKLYLDRGTALKYNKPFQLLVATILSAQCTDVRVNKVTPELFKKYKTVSDFAQADLQQLQSEIRSTGFYKNKAKNIKNACRQIQKDYGGKLPGELKELVKLPGVGRKTANVILGNAFDIPGITCDTHVIRLSGRLGLSANSDPEKLEYDLMEIVPKKEWTNFSNALIYHGRSVCKARKPDCDNCQIAEYCPAANKPDLW
jgi:endonuclease-3